MILSFYYHLEKQAINKKVIVSGNQLSLNYHPKYQRYFTPWAPAAPSLAQQTT